MLQSARRPCNEWTNFGTLISVCPFVSLNFIASVCGTIRLFTSECLLPIQIYLEVTEKAGKTSQVLDWKTLAHCIGGRYRDALWVAFWPICKYWDAIEQIQCVFLTASSSISGLPCLSMPFALSWMSFLFCFLSWKDLLRDFFPQWSLLQFPFLPTRDTNFPQEKQVIPGKYNSTLNLQFLCLLSMHGCLCEG